MPKRPYDVVFVSGYFNPLHAGHVRLIAGAAEVAPVVCVIVNNDAQQRRKKGRVIVDEAERMEVVGALADVDRVVLAADTDATIRATLTELARSLSGLRLAFANGGDRASTEDVPETAVCEAWGIERVYHYPRSAPSGGRSPRSGV